MKLMLASHDDEALGVKENGHVERYFCRRSGHVFRILTTRSRTRSSVVAVFSIWRNFKRALFRFLFEFIQRKQTST